MNFDFLKGLKGLDTVYKPCTDAEELVKSKPYLSLIAARKSAELLAKFVYMAAHASALDGLTFADILADYQVRNFINNRHVMDAFHYIRKNGNSAVHGNHEAEAETALAVLQNLHFVAGETAKDLDLISSYPDFDENIDEHPEASFTDDVQISEKAMQMFIEYVEQQKITKSLVTFDSRNPAHLAYVVHGRVEMHEHIEFDHQPYYQSTLEYVQRYVQFLHRMALKREGVVDNSPGTFKLVLSLDGENAYTSHDGQDLLNVLYDRLPLAKCFAIDCYVYANLRSFYENPDPNAFTNAIDEEDLWQGRGMADHLEGLKRREKFVYKAVFRYPDDDTRTEFAFIRNGKSYDVEDLCKRDVLQIADGCEFYGNGITMHAEFDYEAHQDLVHQLREAVLAYLPEEQHSLLYL
ncbi:MAG: hypothetical protein PUD16_09065 [bacterium]|nr:hypothetical protein [bacterium]